LIRLSTGKLDKISNKAKIYEEEIIKVESKK